MKIRYARISTQDQNFNLQIDALKHEGCGKIIRDTIVWSQGREGWS